MENSSFMVSGIIMIAALYIPGMLVLHGYKKLCMWSGDRVFAFAARLPDRLLVSLAILMSAACVARVDGIFGDIPVLLILLLTCALIVGLGIVVSMLLFGRRTNDNVACALAQCVVVGAFCTEFFSRFLPQQYMVTSETAFTLGSFSTAFIILAILGVKTLFLRRKT